MAREWQHRVQNPRTWCHVFQGVATYMTFSQLTFVLIPRPLWFSHYHLRHRMCDCFIMSRKGGVLSIKTVIIRFVTVTVQRKRVQFCFLWMNHDCHFLKIEWPLTTASPFTVRLRDNCLENCSLSTRLRKKFSMFNLVTLQWNLRTKIWIL